MTSTNSLYFKNNNNEFIKTANLDSPNFTGTPSVLTPQKNYQSLRIVNVDFIKNYISGKLFKFNFDTITSFENTVTLIPNKEYIIYITGFINTPENDSEDIVLGSVVVLDNEDNVIAQSDTSTSEIYKSTGGIIQSAIIAFRSPLSGNIKTYVNYGGTKGEIPSNYLCVIRVDKDDMCDITVEESEHQTLVLYANYEEYTGNNFLIGRNSVFKTKVIPDIGYISGNVSPATEGIIEGNMTFTISPAIYNPCNITINQTPNQTIVVTSEEIEHTQSFIGRYGSMYTVRVVPDTGYSPGTPNINIGTITNSITISATSPRAIYHSISVQQWNHQTITLTRMDTGETTTTVFSVLEGTRILVEVTTDPGYISGELNVATAFDANEDIVVTSTNPIRRTYV